MMFCNIEDRTGSLEMLVFPNVVQRCKGLLQENAILVVVGRLSIREEESPKIICEYVQTTEEAEHAPAPAGARQGRSPGQRRAGSAEVPVETVPAKALYVMLPQNTPEGLEQVRQIALRHRGAHPLIICFADTRKALKASRNLFVDLSDALLQEMERQFGEKFVKCK